MNSPNIGGGPDLSADDARSSGRHRDLLAIVMFAVLAAIFHAKIFFSGSDQIIDTPDIRQYFLWLHQFAREEILAGRLPLWNPYNYCGMPFAANPQVALFYPPTWLYLIEPVAQAHKHLIVLHLWMSGAFMYLFLRQIRLAQFAALIGALPYMLGNYAMANAAVGHLTVLFTMAWLPLIVLLFDRGLIQRSWRMMIACGAAMAAQLLAGEPQTTYYTALLLALYGLVRLIRPTPTVRWLDIQALGFWIVGLTIVAMVAATVAAIQLVPSAELAMHSDRSASDFTFAALFSFPPDGLISWIIPWRGTSGFALDGTSLRARMAWEWPCYAGIFTLIMAAVSLVVRGAPPLRAVRIVAIVALLLMLGRYTPLYRVLFEWLPGVSLFRVPARALVLLHWSIAVMSGFGVDHLFRHGAANWQKPRWRMIAITFIALIAIGMAACVGVLGVRRLVYDANGLLQVGERIALTEPLIVNAMIGLAIALGALVVFRWTPKSWSLTIILAALSLDLYLARSPIPLASYQVAKDPSYVLLTAVRDSADAPVHPFRIDLPLHTVPANMAMAARVENVNGYSPLALRHFYEFVHAMRGIEPSRRTRYELPQHLYQIDEPFPTPILNVWYATRWERSTQSFRALTAQRVLPRAWAIHRIEVIEDEQATLQRIRQADFDPANTVILDHTPTAPATGFGPPGKVTVRRVNPTELEIRADMFRAGYVVVSEMCYPGWRAICDDNPIDLIRADYLLTAFVLPEGVHTVRYQYKPESFLRGAQVSGCAATILAAFAAWQWRGWRRRRRNASSSGA